MLLHLPRDRRREKRADDFEFDPEAGTGSASGGDTVTEPDETTSLLARTPHARDDAYALLPSTSFASGTSVHLG